LLKVRDVLCLVLEADKYPCIGNEDWPKAQRMSAAALEKERLRSRLLTIRRNLLGG
jgi:hypothetical protein